MDMTDMTEQKLLDAALEEFARKGYVGTTTMSIAEKAGFSEKTLFRKFTTKQNLFDEVIVYGIKKMDNDAQSGVFIDKEFETPGEFLDAYVRNLMKFFRNNFEFFKLGFNEDSKLAEPIMGERVSYLCKYIEKNMPNQKIDYMTFTLSISSFIYMLNFEKYHGRVGNNYEILLKKFIDNLLLCIE